MVLTSNMWKTLTLLVVIVVLCPSLSLGGIVVAGPAPRDNPDLRGKYIRDLIPRDRFKKNVISCSASHACPGNQCCRNDAGNPVNSGGWENRFDQLNTETGICSPRKSGAGKVCSPGRCDCEPGYECYRTITGVCCSPYTCWRAEDAQRDRDFWRNCTPPTCFFPPSANLG